MKRSRVLPIFLAAVLAACVTTVPTDGRLVLPSSLRDGEGLVFGSIEIRLPGGVLTAEEAEMIEALQERELTANLRRYVVRGMALYSWRDYGGDSFTVPCRTGGEQPFVLRGPAGSYAVEELHDDHGWGEPCRVRDLATFEVRPGKITYVGKLVVEVGFRSERFMVFTRTAWKQDYPERWLDMALEAEDTRDRTLLELGAEPGLVPSEIETELMSAGTGGQWSLQTTEPPKVPGTR